MYNIINKKNLERFTRFDNIRLLKLLEVIQFSTIGFILGLILGGLLDKYTPNLDTTANHSLNKYIVLVETILHMSFLIIIGYYIEKFSNIFNFCCGFMHYKYIPSYHKESTIGITIGLAFIFNATQTKLKNKIAYLTKHFI